MKPPLTWVLLALGGCAGSGRDAAPLPTPSEGRRERDDAIVALYDGQPLRWRAVAEKMIEIDPRTAVETYLRWRVVDDRRKELGVAPGPDELRRRAEAQLAFARKTLTEKDLREKLAADGLGVHEYAEKLAGSAWLSQTLTLELMVRYQSLWDGTITIDRLAFVEEAEARRFALRCKETGFEAAAEAVAPLRGIRLLPRERFARSAPPTDPALDAWIVKALDALQPGELTDVESSRTDLKYVSRLVEKTPGMSTPYAEAKGAVLESVLKDPPSPEEIRRWIASRMAGARLEYPAKSGGFTNN